MTVADSLAPLVGAIFASQVPIAVRGWDGSQSGPADATWFLTFRNRRALRRLLWAPNELGLARGYVSGDIDFEGDLHEFMSALDESTDARSGPRVHISPAAAVELLKAALRLRAIGVPPKAPPEEGSTRRGTRHGRARDAAAIAHHYDVGNDFYRLILNQSMAYSCAYWAAPGDTLDEAQYAKCDLVARKLGLSPGMHVLDVGCGWGTFAAHVARTYGVTVVGITLSREQADYARHRISVQGLSEQVEIRVQDYRDVTDGPYDAIASIGMAEHVGAAQLSRYAQKLYELLVPTGRLLNHAIARRPVSAPQSSRSSFIDRYVFPDGELEPVATMVDALEGAGFEVRDMESLREHYGRTLRAWLTNLEANWGKVIEAGGPGRARVWRLYMAGCAVAFDANRIGVNQIIAVKTTARGDSGMPPTRQSFTVPDDRVPQPHQGAPPPGTWAPHPPALDRTNFRIGPHTEEKT
ncbi:cyclopropane-fatty-acyl-phospholipid synthase family protein [Mycobacterium sp.]|uniref:cyclopropane-fatty-acyl-phospholipid synthase family protein n=1 Tax=Mycobacterium sp. TaxID=1785 RepID=UPI0031D2DA24